MMKILPFLAFFINAFTIAQTPCVNGFAGPYPCDGMDLMSHISLNEFNSDRGNDSWGWTDPQNNKEYAIMCLGNGTAFVDISDPVNPIYLGKLPTHAGTGNSTWRDAKVYNNYVFVVSDFNPNHGIQVFDLTRLRNVQNAPATFTEDAHFDGFGSCHNIFVNEDTGYLYAYGADSNNGGPIFINIQDPLNPVQEGQFTDDFYCHDAQVVIYDGPDADYTGKEILFGSNVNYLSIVDVTDKANPVGISNGFYSNTVYAHQAWLTEDKHYLILGDEIDEETHGLNTRTIVFDVSDLDNPVVAFYYEAQNIPAIDHNGYVVGDKFYLSSYRAGLRVFDISNIENETMVETNYFDTYPADNDANYDGAWSVYPYFASGNIVISDINRGLFIVRDQLLGMNDNEALNFAVYPNPAKDFVTISSKVEPISQVEIYNVLGQKVMDQNFKETLSENINVSNLQAGMYVMKINSATTKRLLID